MSAVVRTAMIGELIRDWRQRRRLSQLDLAVEAEVSTRHLSFVETGRAKPSREFVLHLAEYLEVPLRERNHLLLAAGFAPIYTETTLEDDAMGPVREAIDRLLTGHEPYPALIVDGRWNLVSANRPMAAMLQGVSPELLRPPANALRIALHPDGLAPRIVNFDSYSAHLMGRLRRRLAASADAELLALRDELRQYPHVSQGRTSSPDPAEMLYSPLVVRFAGADLTFFSIIATFGTALDVTLAELSIEAFYPSDPATTAAVRAAWG